MNHKETVMHFNRKNLARKFTIGLIYDENENVFKYGISYMNPVDKNYVKRKGRVRALGRAASNHPDGVIPEEKIEKYGGSFNFLKSIADSISNSLTLFGSGENKRHLEFGYKELVKNTIVREIDKMVQKNS